MESLLGQCASQSIGTSNHLFSVLIQTLIAAQCGIVPQDMWPADYGPTAMKSGRILPLTFPFT